MSMEKRAWEKIEGFLSSDTFNGFTKDDLFILRFVKKGWGQDIAALSNMAEAISLRHEAGLLDSAKSQTLLRSALSERPTRPFRLIGLTFRPSRIWVHSDITLSI